MEVKIVDGSSEDDDDTVAQHAHEGDQCKAQNLEHLSQVSVLVR